MPRYLGKLTLLAALVLAVFVGPSAVQGVEGYPAERRAEAQAAAPNWNAVDDFVYQLQDADLTAIGRTKYDLVITDYSRDGSDEQKFTAQEISTLKTSPGGPKLVLSYIEHRRGRRLPLVLADPLGR